MTTIKSSGDKATVIVQGLLTLARSGSALGIAEVWGTVKDHGDYIDINSEIMKGTTFDRYFPVLRTHKEIETVDETKDNLMAHGEKCWEWTTFSTSARQPRSCSGVWGYTVETVESGEKAIGCLRYNKVDILLLDMIMMPGIDGHETYRQIVRRTPGQKAIIVSGYSESDKVCEAQA